MPAKKKTDSKKLPAKKAAKDEAGYGKTKAAKAFGAKMAKKKK